MASTKKRPGFTVIRGGKLLDSKKRRAVSADILIKGDTIAEIGRPGLAAPSGAVAIDAKGMLMHPGLVNGHTHGHGNLGKGMHDRWTLETLLTASQWVGTGRNLEDKYLASLIGAAEMVMKGCTAAYDLAAEFPLPSVEGLSAMAEAYEEVGMRCVLAPMVADITFFNAIPGLTCYRSQGAFYLFPNISGTGLRSADFCARLLEQEKVAAVPGIAFGADDYIRLSYATSLANIQKGLERMDCFVRGLKR